MKLTRTLLAIAAASAIISIALEFLLIGEDAHAPFPYGDVPGVWVLFGLIWAAVLIFVPKWVGHAFLMKHDDPYAEVETHTVSDGEGAHE
ncbi:MAG: hypothetical protein WD533_00145 [Dehalococcoidia bacterium]